MTYSFRRSEPSDIPEIMAVYQKTSSYAYRDRSYVDVHLMARVQLPNE